ncbi:N-acetyltransferase [Vibrio sp. vnigr-6D03]|uniref:GNAT family N-acetyltransferase n=1 Tax=Vibrio sp. vnigr-6D03 TaxID=2058088 RepID=UPI000C34DC9D|nr:GNAT family N-acetyltransferase [Vibrio sp. vnigr-6D03]PKF81202.1 N-acetyltransferase [Vibrio sp. vnigr-6D03]
MNDDIAVIHDIQAKEFRIEVAPESWAKVTYRQEGDVFFVDHSSVPESLRGQGKGAVMMEAALLEIEKLNVKIVPECSYVRHYVNKHENWHHLLAE